ncbi:hypothetical protein G6F70_003265 [Rhizopus microsporus]|nr:hypothetical protein G6F71_003128 [Rhizopus microsporus]KAG1201316.1 hypothetical protein G6F70_003265 [Rhizopus microsporus]KAG1213367.1 hypothetical protein G6F69_002879 [Rhizopus microsporus]KAG1235482.1 hypothetical protein G6F67_002729 [Rhizopus microsporus]KAG1267598.1 hypothetical protein G6F68_001797 [Rhizopus microsporus]
MYYYRLKCILYTSDLTLDLPTDLFSDFSAVKNCSDHFESYPHQPIEQKTTTIRKPSISVHENSPPTPIEMPKLQQSNQSLDEKIDFRLGQIELHAVDNQSTVDVQLGYGVLHLYRDWHHTDLPDTRIAQDESLNKEQDQQDDTDRIICILAVPSYMSNEDFMQFLGATRDDIVQYRFIRDFSPNKYTVLLKFRDRRSAFMCYQKYNGRRFSMSEPEISHAVYLASNKLETYLISDKKQFPYMKDTLSQDLVRKVTDLELPTCPVCLERMDESITGLLSIQCRHTVQCYCIDKWGHGKCSVCRHSQRPVLTDPRRQPQMQQQLFGECFECQSTDSLWICMICGHIGCGRYQEAHAYDHYMATNHLYALEIETQRIWDYLGDGYVHRLLQNMVDGAIVELPPNEANSSKSSLGHSHDEDEPKSGDSSTKNSSIIRPTDGMMNKLENISTEYTFMLTSQMDSQRMYYEDQLDTLTKQASTIESEIQRMTDYLNSVQQAQEHLKETDTNLEHILIENKKEKDRMDKKVAQVKERYNKVQNNLNEEKAVTKSLTKNNTLLKKQVEEKEKMIEKLTRQVMDLMQVLESE